MNIDLHAHTNQSDGLLAPQQLIDLAMENGVDMLSITDHDTISAYALINKLPRSLKLIPGIEISCSWNNRTIHVLGLDVDISNQNFIKTIKDVANQRLKRGEKISKALEKLGIKNSLDGALKYADQNLGRPHFAQYLVECGVAKSSDDAFKKYLGKGKVGDVKFEWMEIKRAVELINDAGGVAVVAHPLAYKFTNTKLIELLEEFKFFGGRGIEIISGFQTQEMTDKLTNCAIKYDLVGSQGSDFHFSNKNYSSLGKCPSISPSIKPVWDLFD